MPVLVLVLPPSVHGSPVAQSPSVPEVRQPKRDRVSMIDSVLDPEARKTSSKSGHQSARRPVNFEIPSSVRNEINVSIKLPKYIDLEVLTVQVSVRVFLAPHFCLAFRAKMSISLNLVYTAEGLWSSRTFGVAVQCHYLWRSTSQPKAIIESGGDGDSVAVMSFPISQV